MLEAGRRYRIVRKGKVVMILILMLRVKSVVEIVGM